MTKNGTTNGTSRNHYVPRTLRLVYFLRLFNRIRWGAGAAALLVIAFAQFVLKLQIPYRYLYPVAAGILVYNIVFVHLVNAVDKMAGEKRADLPENGPTRLLALLQINFDFAALFALLHFSGGLENPFIIISILHVVVAGTLLEPRQTLFEAFLATGLLFAMGIGEKTGLLTHYHPTEVLGPTDPSTHWFFVLGLPAVLGFAMFALAGLTILIMNERARRRDQIIALKSDLEEKNTRLIRVDQMRKGLLAVASHDLKAPIGAVANYLMTLKDEYLGPINERQAHVIERSLIRLDQLGSFISDVLSIQAIQRGELRRNIRTINLVPLLEEAIENGNDRAQSKNIQLDSQIHDPAIVVDASGERMMQVFNNLISNAVKYTPDGGRVTVAAEVAEMNFVLHVTDTGIGISEDDQRNLFGEFFRAKAVKKDYEGTGLGLAVAQRIIEAHNGHIDVSSQLGQGATFTVTIPLKQQLTTPPPPAVSPAEIELTDDA